MTLARKLFGLVAVVVSAAPAAAQYTHPRPAPQGPTRLVFPAPPWITNGPRAGMPGGPGVVTQPGQAPVVNEAAPAPMASPPMLLPQTPAPGIVLPAVPATPPVPPAGVAPAGATAPRTAPGPRSTTPVRPDVWRPGTATVPGTIVPAPKKGS